MVSSHELLPQALLLGLKLEIWGWGADIIASQGHESQPHYY